MIVRLNEQSTDCIAFDNAVEVKEIGIVVQTYQIIVDQLIENGNVIAQRLEMGRKD